MYWHIIYYTSLLYMPVCVCIDRHEADLYFCFFRLMILQQQTIIKTLITTLSFIHLINFISLPGTCTTNTFTKMWLFCCYFKQLETLWNFHKKSCMMCTGSFPAKTSHPLVNVIIPWHKLKRRRNAITSFLVSVQSLTQSTNSMSSIDIYL